MVLKLIQRLVVRKEFLKILRPAERVKVSKYRIALNGSRILHPDVVRVRIHGHYLFLYLLRLIREVNAVAEGLAHLGLAVYAGKP